MKSQNRQPASYNKKFICVKCNNNHGLYIRPFNNASLGHAPYREYERPSEKLFYESLSKFIVPSVLLLITSKVYELISTI